MLHTADKLIARHSTWTTMRNDAKRALLVLLFLVIANPYQHALAVDPPSEVDDEARFQLKCQPTKSFPAGSACARLQSAWRLYLVASTSADHRNLTVALRDVRASPKESRPIIEPVSEIALLSYYELANAHDVWLRWDLVTANLTEEDRKSLASAQWLTRLALAHSDPYAALEKLNKELGSNATENEAGLRMLLAGQIANNLIRLNAAAAPTTEDSANQKFAAYVSANKRDFATSELCYNGPVYIGRHWELAEKQFKASKIAEAAGYLALTRGECGECEGIFDCYLDRGLSDLQNFLRKHPRTIYSREMVLSAEYRIRNSFSEREAQADYLSADARYSPADAAQTLIRFESDLKHVDPVQLVSLKALLGDLYIKLNQPANAKRVADWLAMHAPETAARRNVVDALAGMKPLELRLKSPVAHGPNILALHWEQRPSFSKAPLQVWRSEDPAFKSAKPIGDILPPDTATAIDRTVKPGICYWYHIAASGAEVNPLSHAAFAQTWSAVPSFSSLAFDTATRTLFGIGRLREGGQSTALMKFLPSEVPQVGRIFASDEPRPSPVEWPSWWVDRDAGIVVEVDTMPAAPKPTDGTNSETSSTSQMDIPKRIWQGVSLNRKHGVIAHSPNAVRARDGKSFYILQNDELRQRDTTGQTLDLIYEVAFPFPPSDGNFRNIYLFARKNGEIWLIGSRQVPDGNSKFFLRKFRGKTIVDVPLPNGNHGFRDDAGAWLYDPDADGVWAANYKEGPALFGFDGKFKRNMDFSGGARSIVRGVALARDSLNGDLFVASTSEVVRVTKQGTVSTVWQTPKEQNWHAAGQSCPAVATKLDQFKIDFAARECEIEAERLKTSDAKCKTNRAEIAK